MSKQKLTDSELKASMEEAIERMRDIVNNSPEESKATNAANALSGLISRYKEMFNPASEEPTKLRSVKNF